MATSQGFQNPECYSRALGGCCREIDREHYVSESILELIFERFGQVRKTVPVKNLAFQDRGVLDTIGVGKLTSKILCRNHHAVLSRFDSVGKAMFVAMDNLNETGLNPQLPAIAATIDGDALERWMLKTLCGGLFSGNFLVAPGERMKGICPPIGWLEILFKDADYPPGQGLYYLYRPPGEIITVDPIILKLTPLMGTDGETVMGLRLLALWIRVRPPGRQSGRWGPDDVRRFLVPARSVSRGRYRLRDSI